ncbi:MAG: ROK family protein [Cyclobacteriaceae bacterium]
MTIGVDLGGTNIRAGVRVGDAITQRSEAPLKDKESLESTLNQLNRIIEPLISDQVRGIGLAVPSIVDAENGIVFNVVNIPSWTRVEIRSILQEMFGLPVAVQNDANCFALGEHHHGLARGCKHMVGITLGTGVGSGVIINGEIYSGKNGGAGEVGYLNYLDKDYEFYGGSFFFHEKHKVEAKDLFEQAAHGSATAIGIWNDYGHHIGNLVKTIVYAYDPEMIVFGGSIANAWRFFEPAMRETISRRFHFPGSMQALKIVRSENENIILLGASALINDQL